MCSFRNYNQDYVILLSEVVDIVPGQELMNFFNDEAFSLSYALYMKVLVFILVWLQVHRLQLQEHPITSFKVVIFIPYHILVLRMYSGPFYNFQDPVTHLWSLKFDHSFFIFQMPILQNFTMSCSYQESIYLMKELLTQLQIYYKLVFMFQLYIMERPPLRGSYLDRGTLALVFRDPVIQQVYKLIFNVMKLYCLPVNFHVDMLLAQD